MSGDPRARASASDPAGGDLIVELLARRPPAGDDEPADRLRVLLELLNRPDRAVPTVWVSGRRGKSSVITMVAALFAALDVTCGAATAPHLQDMRERLRIAGEAIGAESLRDSLLYLEPFLREVDTRFAMPLTFDEVLHVLAATWFADAPVDVAVFEGVVDATGRREVTVELDGAATRVTGADGQTRVLGDDFGVAARQVAVGGQQLTLRGVTGEFADVYLPLHGAHQAANAATALATVEAFLGYSGRFDAELIRRAFASVRLPGRLEVVRRPDAASVLLDGASDGESAAALASALLSEFTLRNRIGVLALVGDAAEPVVDALAGVLAHTVVAPATTPDSADTEDVVAAARRAGMAVEVADTIPAALEFASGVATAEDAVVVTGGLQTAGAARRALGLAPADDLLHTS
jgi:dihydrofolate synthase/folylpolyglutamate synthase